MNISFEKMGNEHQKPVMEIFNYYITTSTAAFPSSALPEPFYKFLMEKSEGYPSYVLKDDDTVIGFCQLGKYNGFPTFKSTVTITYFIAKDYTRKGLGSECLKKLEQEAVKIGIKNIVAEVSSENEQSIEFHKKHGFVVAGELKDIGEKFGRSFGVVYMQKRLEDIV